MKIRMYGFEWMLTGPVKIDELYELLRHRSKEQCTRLGAMVADPETIGGRGITEVICLTKNQAFVARNGVKLAAGQYWIGLILKIRSIKAFCALQSDGTKVTLAAQHLGKGTAAAEVNFFIVNTGSARGLYFHYHQSTWLDRFCRVCREPYEAEVERRNDDLRERARREDWPPERFSSERKSLLGGFRYRVMVRPSELPELASQLTRIKNMTLEFVEEQHEKSKYMVLAANARRISHRLVFGKHEGAQLREIKQGLGQLVKEKMLRKARVEGMLPGDLEQVFELEGNYDSFGDYEYNEIIDDIQVDFGDLETSLVKSPMIQRLLEAACTNPIRNRLDPI